MSDIKTLDQTCARKDQCLEGGFIRPGDETEDFQGETYHKACAEGQKAENKAP